jgi:uncharacterized membrane protein YebE (DUF533 family)
VPVTDEIDHVACQRNRKIERGMAESQTLSVIRLWAAIAWADGKIAEREGESLRRLIGLAKLDPGEATLADALITKSAALPAEIAAPESLSDDAKNGIYRAACRMAMVDDELADAERSLLDQLREKLKIAPDVAKTIEYAVPGLS